MRNGGRNSTAQGFTLIELLAATAIISVLLTALFSVMFSALRLREATWRAVESGIPRAQVAGILRRDLTNAVVPAGTIAGVFIGSSSEANGNYEDTLSFYTTTGVVTSKAPWGDIQSVEYVLETPEDSRTQKGLDLMRKVQRNLLATEIVEPDDTSLWRLARGVKSFQLQYWDETTEEWIEGWDSSAMENENPPAVKARIEFIATQGEKPEAPIEVVCQIGQQPRESATSSSDSGSSSGTDSSETSTGGNTGGGGSSGGDSGGGGFGG